MSNFPKLLFVVGGVVGLIAGTLLVASTRCDNWKAFTVSLLGQAKEREKSSCSELYADKVRRYEKLKAERLNNSKVVPQNMRCLFDYWEPEWVCEAEERVGGIGDGAKFVCAPRILGTGANNSCLIYSIGSLNMIEFETQMHELTNGRCEIHTFDPTLKKFAGSNVATFHRLGLGSKDGTVRSKKPKFKVTDIMGLMENAGHVGRKLDILKIDCEGCEWDAIPSIVKYIKDGVLKVDQLQVEVHLPKPTPKVFEALRPLLNSLDDTNLILFHKERNSWGEGAHRYVEFAYVSPTHAAAAFASTHDCEF